MPEFRFHKRVPRAFQFHPLYAATIPARVYVTKVTNPWSQPFTSFSYEELRDFINAAQAFLIADSRTTTT